MMFNRKRFLLLGSVGVLLLTGLAYTVYTRVPSIAFAASGCNSIAEGSSGKPYYQPTWGNNCEVDLGDDSNFVVAVQVIVNGSGVFDGKTSQCPKEALTQDGSFNTVTQGAVKCFQSRLGLNQSGVVDQGTWDALGVQLITDGNNGNWVDMVVEGGSTIALRMYLASPYKWYVNKYAYGGSQHWCLMDTSSPC